MNSELLFCILLKINLIHVKWLDALSLGTVGLSWSCGVLSDISIQSGTIWILSVANVSVRPPRPPSACIIFIREHVAFV